MSATELHIGTTLRRVVPPLLIGVASVVLGMALTAAVADFDAAGPAILIGLVVAPLFALATLNDPKLGIVGVFVTFPFATVIIPTGVIELQAPEAAVLVVAVLVVVHRLGRGATILPWTNPMWWLLGLFAWSIVALSSALDVGLAFKGVAALAATVVFISLVIGACDSMADVRFVATALTVVATSMAAFALGSGETQEVLFGGSAVAGRLEGTFTQPNQLGSFAALTALVSAGLALSATTTRGRILAAGAMVVQLAAMLLSLSRGAWIGTSFAVLYLIVVLPQARKAVAALAIPAVVVAVAAGAFATAATQVEVVTARFRSFAVLSPYDSRATIWDEAFREIRERPITGYGPGNFPVASTRAASESSTVSADHAHNFLLTWAAEAGIPAALLLIGFSVSMASVAHHARKRVDRRTGAFVACLAAALISVAGQGIVDYTLHFTSILFAVGATAGLLMATDRVTVARGLGPAEP